MCGYIGNLHEAPGVIDLMEELGILLPLPYYQSYQRRMHPALITQEGDKYVISEAMWWYALKREGDKLVPNPDITSFNARNLDAPLWRDAINHRRGIILGTEIGESKDGKRHLMRSKEGLALGAVYKDWEAPNGQIVRSMAVITRPPHPRFSEYHDKSLPAFLPLSKCTLTSWLNPYNDAHDVNIYNILNTSKIYNDLIITSVRTFKNGITVEPTWHLTRD
ncbi:putative SOS response-associated peptidase YedK [Marinimicrobium koreense]|uniref:Putative SOS response-associated peptidase YedK n=1 Tax=Marinimicrobium koreense TaxID=306545 RepID=A0A3N1NJ61_9GAMM|nr:SOS response-associated peptidase family protein [Marinimicrobium koreense]ROQ19864.1 putative SOS response-associated peptidase YedK [Marinimicrobium koreense]